MARFYATVNSDTGTKELTRRGHRRLSTHVCGWKIGVRASCFVNEKGEDCISICVTGGSCENNRILSLGIYRLDGEGSIVDETGKVIHSK